MYEFFCDLVGKQKVKRSTCKNYIIDRDVKKRQEGKKGEVKRNKKKKSGDR